ncbi:MAG TPA: glutamate--tRNA ligase [Gammaproteobacteria bacterium]|jgi:glutamyl-tRNA synthetase|nr:glutamate--tRNA ligase [Gammaproteobacteria bacterium]
MIRTRFAPSPTGMIHLGNARAALFSALYARHHQGKFVLRIEDTDVARSEERFVASLQADLRWLGVDWQEGPGVDGAYGPYWQSQRQKNYEHYYEKLHEKGLIYPCFCSDQSLMLARKLALSQGKPPRYSGKCRALSKADVEAKIAAGEKPAWRFIVPQNKLIPFVDAVKGPQQFNSDDIGDFIIRRADGSPPFLFCNAVDDADMHITHVLRGEDHLANTPRQIMILESLGLPLPQYGHLSLIVGHDGAPLSKRHGSYSLHEMHSSGFLPNALMNYLSRLGHACESQALLNFDELAQQFYLEKLSKSPARFDVNQLLYWQRTAVQALNAEGVWRWLGERVEGIVPLNARVRFADIIKMIVDFPDDAYAWAKIFFHDQAVYDEEAKAIIQQAGEQYFVEAELAVQKYGTDMKPMFEEMKRTLNISGKALFMPLRVALTGKLHGPDMAQISELLGAEKMQHRLSRAFKLASEA